jgi:hypothetical protein
VVDVAAAVVATAVRMSSGTVLIPLTRSSTLLLCSSGMLLERRVEVVHVRGVVLVVMDPHRLFVDVRLQRVVVVRKGWNECAIYVSSL